MNALALKRHVSEMARVEVEARQRCEWLEEECSLYLKDREVFMRAAEEAEERAFAAEKRCAHAHYEVTQLLQQLTTSQVPFFVHCPFFVHFSPGNLTFL